MNTYRAYTRRVGVKGLVLLRWINRQCECGKFLSKHQHYCKECSDKHRKETYKKYRLNNPYKETRTKEEKSEYNKRYYSKNKEKIALQAKVYYNANRELISEKKKVYYLGKIRPLD